MAWLVPGDGAGKDTQGPAGARVSVGAGVRGLVPVPAAVWLDVHELCRGTGREEPCYSYRCFVFLLNQDFPRVPVNLLPVSKHLRVPPVVKSGSKENLEAGDASIFRCLGAVALAVPSPGNALAGTPAHALGMSRPPGEREEQTSKASGKVKKIYFCTNVILSLMYTG